MKKKIGIVDYDMGNLFSVIQACNNVGLNTEVVKGNKELKKLDALILPGVGSFKKAIENIIYLDLFEEIVHFSESRPIMGICLGFQLLFNSSSEFGKTDGLGIVDGEIVRFDNNNVPRIPHMGWNTLSYKKGSENPLKDLTTEEVYFVHSYYAKPKDSDIILSKTRYKDFEFPSAIQYKNVFGTQFHPEKSGQVGLKIYKNWADMNSLL